MGRFEKSREASLEDLPASRWLICCSVSRGTGRVGYRQSLRPVVVVLDAAEPVKDLVPLDERTCTATP